MQQPLIEPPAPAKPRQRKSLIGKNEIKDHLNISLAKLEMLIQSGLPVAKFHKLICSHIDCIDDFIKEKVRGITLP